MRIFRLTLPKFLFTAILFAVFAAISPPLYRYIVLDAHLRGLPFPFAFISDSCTDLVSGCTDFFFVSFLVDLLFWYLVANFFEFMNEQIKKG